MERLLSPRRPMSVGAVVAHLLVVLLGAGMTWVAYGSVVNTDADCRLPAGPNRIAAITFAGTPDRAERAAVLCAVPERDQVARDRDVLVKDIGLALSYTVLLVGACRLGTGLARHRITRRTGMHLACGALAVGLTDLLENGALWLVVDDPARVPWWIGLVTATAVTRLTVLCLVGVFAAAGAAAGIAVVVRALLGPALRPQFDRRLRSTASPADSMAGRLEGEVRAPNDRRFLGPDGTPWRSDPQTTGACFSGGGIRAASFALGALHALQEHDVLKRFRYISTVSGGGYAGMAWQTASRAAFDDPGPVEAEPLSAGSSEAAYVREHSRYLWPPVAPGKRWSSTLTFLAVASTALRGVLFNVGLLLTLLFVVSRPIGWLTSGWTFADDQVNRPGHLWHLAALLLQSAAVVAVAWPIVWRWWDKMGSTRSRKLLGGLSTTAVAAVSAWFVFLLDRPRTFGITLSVGWWLVVLGALIAGIWAYRVRGRSAGPGFGIAIIGLGVAKMWLDGGFKVGPHGDVTLHVVDAVLRMLILFVALLVLLAVLRIIVSVPRDRAKILPVLGGLLCIAAAFALVAVAILQERSVGWAVVLTAVALGAIGMAGRALTRLPSPPKPFVGGAVNAARTMVALVTALIGTVALAFALWRWDVPRVGWTVTDFQRWAFLTAVIAVVYAFVDQKWWSPHTFYKRRLAATFCPVRSADGDASPVPFRIRTTLATWARRVPDRPELLVCAAVYDTERLNPRDIQALPFVFSADYVGSADLGFATTYDLDAVLGAQNQGYGTLQAAAAISGAAISPAIGAVRLASLTQVLAFFNLRQGVWLPSPASVNELRRQGSTRDPTQRWVRTRRLGYLLKEIASRYDTEDRFVYVNDGGQFDNLGLYELFARRCRTMYVFDASGDQAMSVSTLLGTMKTVHDRLGVDFGPLDDTQPLTVPPAGDRMKTVWRDGLFTELLTPLTDPDAVWAAGRATTAAVTVFSAWYPASPGSADRDRATIVFAKARLAKNREGEAPPPLVVEYAGIDQKFPGNSTGDQFVDDIQFDAYVALGRWVADDALARHPIPAPATVGQ